MIIETEYNLGDQVFDILIGNWATIIGISYHIGQKGPKDSCKNTGSIGYWLDNSYMSGARHSWEIQITKTISVT